MSKGRNREKSIILTARVVSMLFTPFYLPLVGMMALFSFSYLGLMPWGYKLQVLTMVYLFTILLPSVLIHLYRRYRGWTLIELGHKERRAVMCGGRFPPTQQPSVEWQERSLSSVSSSVSIPCGGSAWY